MPLKPKNFTKDINENLFDEVKLLALYIEFHDVNITGAQHFGPAPKTCQEFKTAKTAVVSKLVSPVPVSNSTLRHFVDDNLTDSWSGDAPFSSVSV
uniref:Uncharacterized protein n=1 Tax=Romanomermis culicivorax TaxID=13658 RepID=A0A915JYJ1_ROMCU